MVEFVVERAQNPRSDHEDVHFDRTIATIIDTYGTEPVRTAIHRILIDDEPFRTATSLLLSRSASMDPTSLYNLLVPQTALTRGCHTVRSLISR